MLRCSVCQRPLARARADGSEMVKAHRRVTVAPGQRRLICAGCQSQEPSVRRYLKRRRDAD